MYLLATILCFLFNTFEITHNVAYMHSITKSKADVKGDFWQPGTEQKAGMFEKYLNISHGNFKFGSFCFKQIEWGQ